MTCQTGTRVSGHTWPPVTPPTPPALPPPQPHCCLGSGSPAVQAEPPGLAQGRAHPVLCQLTTPPAWPLGSPGTQQLRPRSRQLWQMLEGAGCAGSRERLTACSRWGSPAGPRLLGRQCITDHAGGGGGTMRPQPHCLSLVTPPSSHLSPHQAELPTTVGTQWAYLWGGGFAAPLAREVSGPGIEPVPQLGPEPQLRQCWILNSLHHTETSSNTH